MEEKDNEVDLIKARFMNEFNELRPDLFLPAEWDGDKKDAVLTELRSTKTKTSMFTSIPITCKAADCVYSDTCPLHAKSMAPKGSPCPIELRVMVQFAEDYMEELNVDPANLVEVSMIRDLVDQEIQYIRKSKLLAKDGMIQDSVIGVGNNGEPIISKQLHLAVDLEDKIHKRKNELRKSLLATREAKAKVGQGNLDTAQALSNIFEKIREVDVENDRLIKQKLGIETRDEYIDAQVVDDEG